MLGIQHSQGRASSCEQRDMDGGVVADIRRQNALHVFK